MSQTNLPHDTHDKKPIRSWLSRHRNHISWHVDSALVKCRARNALPRSISHFFHPTRATFFADRGERAGMTQLWSSRAHRKHRYVYISSFTKAIRQKDTMLGKLALVRQLEYWNISWWVAQAFTWGSVVWVINGFAAFLPFCNSNFQKASNSTGWTAFLGATIFEIGSIFGIWEVLNADFMTFELKEKHHNGETNSNTDIEEGGKQNGENQKSELANALNWTHILKEGPKARPKWVWVSADPKYWHQLGWYAAFFQLLAASVFWISGFTAIPAIQDAIKSHTGILDGIFWVPQVVGGVGFVISASFIMLESQNVWWIPRPNSIGWQVGFWNFVGGVGFALSGIFGFYTASWAQYQSPLSTFWGGWAFLIGSVIQWYESVNSK